MFIRVVPIVLALWALVATSPAVAEPVRITLDDGSTVVGEVVSETETSLVLDTESLGQVTIARVRIREMEAGTGARSEARGDPDYNSLLLVPTSETLRKGDSYYRNFEVFFNNLGLAITDDLSLSVMAAFPVDASFRIGSVGAKLRLASLDRSPLGAALAGNVLVVGDQTIYTGTGIVSLGSRLSNLSLAMNVVGTDSDTATFVLVGAGVLIGNHWKAIVEYGNSSDAILDDDDYNGLVNIGLRYFNREYSLTLTGLRPLEVSGGFAFPLVSVSFHF